LIFVQFIVIGDGFRVWKGRRRDGLWTGLFFQGDWKGRNKKIGTLKI